MNRTASGSATRRSLLGILLVGLWLVLGPPLAAAAEEKTADSEEESAAEVEREKGPVEQKKKKESAGKNASGQERTKNRGQTSARPQTKTPPTAAIPGPRKPGWGDSSSGSAEPPLVFTDQDLERFRDSHTGIVSPPPPPPTSEPLKALRDQGERARWRQNKVALLQQEILKLEKQLSRLETKRRSIQNPLLPRPTGDPDPSDEGLNGPELLAKTEEEIQVATEQLETTRMELAIFLQATR